MMSRLTVAGSRDLGVYGRRVAVNRAKGSSARFTFAELCEEVSGRSIVIHAMVSRADTRSHLDLPTTYP